MKITNLTNSPYDLIDAKGKPVRLPARGSINIDPHPQHLNQYRMLGYFRIEDDAPATKVEVPGKPARKAAANAEAPKVED